MAAKKVGILSMFVTAITSNAQKNLDAMGKTTLKLGKTMGNVGLKAAKFGAGLSAGASVGLGALTLSGLKTAGATKLVADRIGTTTERLSQLEFAARLTGTSVDRMQEGLTEMVQRLGEAKTGAGSMADGLKMINLRASDLQKMDPADAFLKISDAVKSLPEADQVFAIDEMFGGDGREMINLISLGSDGINKLAREADELGITLDALGAAKVTQANAKFTKLNAVFGAIGQTLAVEMAPAIIAGTNKILEMIKEAGGIRKVIFTGMKFAAKGAGLLADGLNFLKAGFFGIRMVAEKQLSFVIGHIDDTIQMANKLAVAFGNNFLRGAAQFSSDLRKQIKEGSDESFEGMQKAFEDAVSGKASKGIAKEFRKIQNDANAAAKAAEELRKANAKALKAPESSNAAKKERNAINQILEAKLGDLRRFTLNKQQLELADLKAKGATDQDIQALKAMQKAEQSMLRQKKKQEDLNKAREKGQRLLLAHRTEQEKFKDDLKHIADLYKQGGLTQEQALKISQATFDASAPELVGGFEAGKQAAVVDTRNVSIESLRAVNGQDVDKKQLNQLEQMKDILERMLGELNSPPVFQ